MTLRDGRVLTYDVYGDPDGTPVIFNHGLSDSRLIRNPDESLTASLGVRVLEQHLPPARIVELVGGAPVG